MQAGTTRCKAKRRDGERCTNGIVLSDGYCFMHSPTKQAELASVRSAGGKAKANSARATKLLPAQLRPVFDLILAALDETHSGQLDPRAASAIASLASAAVRVLQAGTLEERLAALEQRLGTG